MLRLLAFLWESLHNHVSVAIVIDVAIVTMLLLDVLLILMIFKVLSVLILLLQLLLILLTPPQASAGSISKTLACLRHNEFFCYTEGSRWERCCSSADACVPNPKVFNVSFCTTSKTSNYEKYYKRCRTESHAITLSGRPCDKDSYCGFNEER